METSKEVQRYCASILTEYPNGATSISKNGKIIFIRYNTGDQVWFDDDGKVVHIITHDGVVMKE